MLKKQSVLTFRIPDLTRHEAHRMASLLVETRVNQIELKPLPPETFKPPKGYSKLGNLQRPITPPGSPETPAQTVDIFAPNLPAIALNDKGCHRAAVRS